jgi:hypothetical protein
MFRATHDVLAEYAKKITMTKSDEWAYEEELRIVVPDLVDIRAGKENHCLRFHGEELYALYVGCRMEPHVRERVIELALKRNPTVKVFVMLPDPFEFKLSPRRLQ